MNKKNYLLLFTALLSVTGCSKDTITLLCKAEKASYKSGDSYVLDSLFEGYEQKFLFHKTVLRFMEAFLVSHLKRLVSLQSLITHEQTMKNGLICIKMDTNLEASLLID